MPLSRKLALGAGAVLAAIVTVLAVLPLAFQGRIASRLKLEIARSVDARVDWQDVRLGLLRDFPHASLSVDGLSVVGVGLFAGDTLAAARQARLVLDLGSVVGYLRRGDPIVVRRIVLRQPSVHLEVLPDGTANWDIARSKAAPSSDSGRAIAVSLRDFRIDGGNLTIDDRHARLTGAVTGLRASLSGDFTRQRFVLATHTRADSVSLRFADVPYLSHVAVALDADVDADLAAHRFTLKDDSLRLNRLLLTATGSVTTGTPNVGLDLDFSSPSTAFRDILSLVPAVYAGPFDRIRTSGTMSVAGRVHGAYGAHAFPAFAVQARVENGAFQYATLPLPARGIGLDLSLRNPGGDADSTVIDLARLHAVIGGRPLDARLVMRTPVSDPDVDLQVTGALDLADLARTVELDSVRQLAGRVAADAAVHARLSDLDAHRYDRVAASGSIQLSRVAVQAAALRHPVSIDTAALQLTPRAAQLTSLAARLGSTDVRATGSLDNLLGFLLRDEDLRGSATVTSRRVALDEWRSKQKSSEVVPVPPHVDFALKAAVDTVTYGALRLAHVTGNVRVKDQRVTVDSLRMNTLGGTVVVDGSYATTLATRPTFDVGVRLAAVDIPAAFTALTTVQTLAPIARWAQGSMTGTVALKGALGPDMVPLFPSLGGRGTIATDRLVLQGAPVFAKLGDALSLDAMRKPSLGAVRFSFDVADGRVHVSPFTAAIGGTQLTVSGSNGIDQSLSYELALALPRSALGGAAGATVARLASQAGVAGAAMTAGAVQLQAHVRGTATNPTVSVDFAGVAASVADAARSAVQQAGTARIDSTKRKADSVAAAAVSRARAQADSIVAQAQRQADTIRARARDLAATTRRTAAAHADSLVARASNPVARAAAQVAAGRLRQEADRRAEQIVHEGDAKADAILALARQQADTLLAGRR